MDIFISSSLLFILAILSCIFLFWFFPKPTNKKLNNLPPGKTGWPIIGESLEYFSLGQKGLPEKFIRERMEKYSADVFTTSLGGGENMAVFCGDVGNKFLFSNENKLIVTWWPPAISKIIHAARASAEETKVVRNIVVEFIKRESLKVFTPLIDQTTREHFDAEWRGGQTEVKALDLARMMTFKLTCWLLMSMDDSECVQRLLGIFGTVIAGFRSYPIDFPGTSFNRAVKAVELIKKDILQVIEQRQRGDKLPSQADLLSRLMDHHSKTGTHKTFSEEEMAHIIVGLLIAGHETTSIVLTSVIYFLADHPRVYAKVFEEQMKITQSKASTEELLNWEDVSNMKYSRNVINEVMRLVSPSPGGYKQVIREFRYGDFIIPKGWKTFWSVYSTHKDPKYFKNPEEFDPSRFEGDGPLPFTFIPFGGGPRMCPGYEYARLVILIFMHHLVTNFKWEKVFPNEIFTYTPFPIPENGLPIRLSPHTL